jgi:hypothetical protein
MRPCASPRGARNAATASRESRSTFKVNTAPSSRPGDKPSTKAFSAITVAPKPLPSAPVETHSKNTCGARTDQQRARREQCHRNEVAAQPQQQHSSQSEPAREPRPRGGGENRHSDSGDEHSAISGAGKMEAGRAHESRAGRWKRDQRQGLRDAAEVDQENRELAGDLRRGAHPLS